MARSRGSITWQLANLQRMLQVQQVRRHLASSSSSSSSSSCCQFVGFLPGWNCIAHSFIHSPVESLVGLFIHSSGSLAERERERERERDWYQDFFKVDGLSSGALIRASYEMFVGIWEGFLSDSLELISYWLRFSRYFIIFIEIFVVVKKKKWRQLKFQLKFDCIPARILKDSLRFSGADFVWIEILTLNQLCWNSQLIKAHQIDCQKHSECVDFNRPKMTRKFIFKIYKKSHMFFEYSNLNSQNMKMILRRLFELLILIKSQSFQKCVNPKCVQNAKTQNFIKKI